MLTLHCTETDDVKAFVVIFMWKSSWVNSSVWPDKRNEQRAANSPLELPVVPAKIGVGA